MTFDAKVLEELVATGGKLAAKIVSEALRGSETADEALARLRAVDERLPEAYAAMTAALASNDAAEDARRARAKQEEPS